MRRDSRSKQGGKKRVGRGVKSKRLPLLSAHGWWFVLLAMYLCFRFVWAHGFCLSFLCAMCFHVNCLDPTHPSSFPSWFPMYSLSVICAVLVRFVFPVTPSWSSQVAGQDNVLVSFVLFSSFLVLVFVPSRVSCFPARLAVVWACFWQSFLLIFTFVIKDLITKTFWNLPGCSAYGFCLQKLLTLNNFISVFKKAIEIYYIFIEIKKEKCV